MTECNDNNFEDQSCCGSCNLAFVGEIAPYFQATSYHDGKFVNIDSDNYKGKWLVLFFYPADFTFVCPTELGELQDRYETFQKMGAEIVSISTDTHFTHMGWAQGSPTIKKVKYPMLGDPSGEISSDYGVYQENGLAQRGTFIIDPDGILQSIEISAEGLGRDVGEIERKLEALQFMKKNPGTACPNKWKKNGELKPSEKLVGKI